MPLHVATRADDGDKHQYDINCLLYHKGKLYSASDDGKIKAWEADLKLICETQAHPCSVYWITASDDTLYSCSNDGTVKAWSLDKLQEKGTIVQETDTEFWIIRYVDGVLYIGDNQGNIRIYRNNKIYGTINVAEPVKDMIINKNLLFSVKDTDVVVTNLLLQGEHIQFGVKKTLPGRAPLTIIDNKLIYSHQNGKDLILIDINGNFDKPHEANALHQMIINALASTNWNGKSVIFSGGWEKELIQWCLVDDIKLQKLATCNVDIVVNTIAIGGKDQVYVGGGDGHIVRVDL